ncbi:MAG: DUF438 domain-containing protein [Candidatus Bathyarchaeia archaeon]
MAEPFSEKSDKKGYLKNLIRRLHEGASPEEIKEKFRAIKDTTPAEIAHIEEELVREGMSREDIHRLCDIHLAVLGEPLEREETLAPAGHPIYVLMEEHRLLLKFADELKKTAREFIGLESFDSVHGQMGRLGHIVGRFKEAESHYTREENVLFPYLERHGITQPPAIMWMEHNKIRETKKNLNSLVEKHKDMAFQEFAKQLDEVAASLAEMLSNHFYKENKILFPTALTVIGESEWEEIGRQFDELGYCCFTPEQARVAATTTAAGAPAPKAGAEGLIYFKTGSLSRIEMEAILNTLPVDITFVDKEDTVRYFSQSKSRIFVRTKAVIGRKVQQCHPQKSVHLVNQILDDFKSGRRDVADFWIDQKGRLIYIRYFAVRGCDGSYLGCLEVTQDITDIKKIEGEKRLL